MATTVLTRFVRKGGKLGWKLYSLHRIHPESKDFATRVCASMKKQGFNMEVVNFGESYAPYIIAEFRTRRDALEYKHLLETNAPTQELIDWSAKHGYGITRKNYGSARKKK